MNPNDSTARKGSQYNNLAELLEIPMEELFERFPGVIEGGKMCSNIEHITKIEDLFPYITMTKKELKKDNAWWVLKSFLNPQYSSQS